jgi:outer membrane protein, multidrug efflux system
MPQHRTPRPLRPIAATLVMVMAAAACSVTPDYQRPDAPVAGTYRNANGTDKPLSAPTTQWWKSFGSDELNRLVDTALANNHDVKAAAQRVIQAEQLAKAAGASLLPTLGLSGGESITAPAGGIGTAVRDQTPVYSTRTYQAGLRINYEVDLWGKNAATEDAAVANAQANEFDRQTLTLSLVSDVVSTYMTTLALRDLYTISETGRNNARKTLDAVEARASVREATQIELNQQRGALARAESQLVGYRLQLEQTISRLALLMGQSPTQKLVLTGTSLKSLTVPEIAPGLPSDLLLRRPDISKVEAMLRSANANIGAARANFLPSISLTGDGGRGSFSLVSLLSPYSLYYNLASSITQTIFDGGRNKAQEKYSEAKFAELVQTYAQTVLGALQDVESTLAADSLLGQQEMADSQLLDSAVAAYDLSRAAFAAGRIEYQTLLETERTQLSSEQGLVQTRFGRLRNSVALFKALGGDLTTPIKDPDADK